MGDPPLTLRAVAGRLAVIVVSTLLTLGVLEVALRLFGPAPPPPEDSLRTFTEYDPDLGWRGRPSAKGTYRTSAFLIDVALNRDGFRDDEEEDASPPGVTSKDARRGRPVIALLGDSFAWGFGVQRGEMFADRVEAAIPGCRVQNFGVCAYGTDQELLVLRRRLETLRSRVVLVEFAVGNDLDNILSARAYNLPKPRFVLESGALSLTGVPVPRTPNWDRAARTGFRDFATAHVHIYAWARPRWANLRGRAERLMPFLRPAKQGLRIEMLRREPGHRVERGWMLAEAILADIARESAAVGARTAILVVPDRTQVDESVWNAVVKEQGLDPADYDRDAPDRRLAEIGARQGIIVVDPLGALRAGAARGETLFIPGDPHWNAEGHRIAADVLVPALQGLLTNESPSQESNPANGAR